MRIPRSSAAGLVVGQYDFDLLITAYREQFGQHHGLLMMILLTSPRSAQLIPRAVLQLYFAPTLHAADLVLLR
jgi:hypothetical protein